MQSNTNNPQLIEQQLVDLVNANLPMVAHLSSGALHIPFKHQPNLCSISANVVGLGSHEVVPAANAQHWFDTERFERLAFHSGGLEERDDHQEKIENCKT